MLVGHTRIFVSFLTQEMMIQEIIDRKTQSRGVTGEITDCTLRGEEHSLLTGPQIHLQQLLMRKRFQSCFGQKILTECLKNILIDKYNYQ